MISLAQTTRISLILRIGDPSDDDAWLQFVDIYGPLLYRFGRRKGLQDADAADLTQDVMREVAGAIGRFDYDPAVGRFRNWLFVIARRQLSQRIRRFERNATGGDDTQRLETLREVPDQSSDEDVWETEYRRHLFQWAAEQIKSEFAASTWQAFWKAAVEGMKPIDVARDLGISIGSVYVAKNRVLSRLRKKVSLIDDSVQV